MKTRSGFISNSSSTSFVVCNIDMISAADIEIDAHGLSYPIKQVRQQVVDILQELKENNIFGTESGYADDSDAYNAIIDYIEKHEERHLIAEVDMGSDRTSYMIVATKEMIEEKRHEGKKRLCQQF